VVEQLLANGPEALTETKSLAIESSFGGMAVDDDAYTRLVRMHSAKRQTAEASEGLASFAEQTRGELGSGQGIIWPAQLNSRGRCYAGSGKPRRLPAASAAAIRYRPVSARGSGLRFAASAAS